MTKTLKELQEEHPCIEGVLKVFAAFGAKGCTMRERALVALIAAKREDEARIAELTQRDLDWYDASPADAFAMLTAAQAKVSELERDLLVQAGRSDGKNIIIRELGAKLTAEQQAHAETIAALEFYADARSYDEFGVPIIKHKGHRSCKVPDMGRTAQAALARQASINRPTDKAPTDDRGEGEK